MTAPLGIGLTLSGDAADLTRALSRIESFTRGDHRMVVAADHLPDELRAHLAGRRIPFVTGAPRGPAWNANRALLALLAQGCDPVVLLDEGVSPADPNWDAGWRAAAAVFGIVGAASAGVIRRAKAGTGAPLDPIRGTSIAPRALGLSAALVEVAGFFDLDAPAERAVEAEMTERAGLAQRWPAALGPAPVPLYILGGLRPHAARKTPRDATGVPAPPDAKPPEGPHRLPWRSEAERDLLRAELADAGVEAEPVIRALSGRTALLATPVMHDALARALEDERGFLLHEGWVASIGSNIPAFRDDVVPWFNYAVVGLLQERVQPDWRVFEFGCGYSTLWWSRHVREITAVEHHAGWIAAIRPLLDPARATVMQREPAAFPAALDSVEGDFDVIVVDGEERPACALASLPRLSARGVLLFDNTHRTAYAGAVAAIEAAGFRQLRLKAPAPMTMRAETSSFFYRDGNCFGF